MASDPTEIAESGTGRPATDAELAETAAAFLLEATAKLAEVRAEVSALRAALEEIAVDGCGFWPDSCFSEDRQSWRRGEGDRCCPCLARDALTRYPRENR